MQALARRAACVRAGAAEALAAQVLRAIPPAPGAVVAGYWPFGSEMDVRPLLHALAARDYALALPETTPKGQALIFRAWHAGAALVPGRWGTMHPSGPPVTPDYVLVPLLAFDQALHRLGYGGGYYDRTLAGLPHAITVGCAYAAQEVPYVPVGPYDRSLTAVATEIRVFWPPV